MKNADASVDGYIASYPPKVRAALKKIRRTIHETVPGAGEKISYRMPTITLDGRRLVYFAGWEKHVAVYPIPEGDAAFERALAPYRRSKGTLHFQLDEPIPCPLIARVVQLLVKARTKKISRKRP